MYEMLEGVPDIWEPAKCRLCNIKVQSEGMENVYLGKVNLLFSQFFSDLQNVNLQRKILIISV